MTLIAKMTTDQDIPKARRLRFAGRDVPLPQTRAFRIALGIALMLGGLAGFLPILGFWMVPLGLLVLSVDMPFVRRARRRLAVWWGRLRGR
jgi:hypothetical protein